VSQTEQYVRGDVPVTVRMQPELLNRLRQVAADDDRPPSVLARKLIREGLERLTESDQREPAGLP
jgi:predicted transcriptional regulator